MKRIGNEFIAWAVLILVFTTAVSYMYAEKRSKDKELPYMGVYTEYNAIDDKTNKVSRFKILTIPGDNIACIIVSESVSCLVIE